MEAQQNHLKHAAREIYTWSKLQHPHILSLLGLAEYRGRISMVSPWIQGGPARYRLKRISKPVNWPLLCTKIADALSYLHHSGVIHGDLKGDNVLVSEDTGEPFVTDFGNAVLQEHTLQFAATSSTRQHISSRWTAPEIWHGGLRSFEADIFALGMTILEVITLDVPYAGMSDAAVMFAILKSEHPKRPETHIPSTSEHGDMLWSLLEDCWMADSAMRPVAMTVRDKVKGVERW
ncbi:hypothetical protein FRC09_000701 [Ceratobasidium sp. 395]|nr:hypothetical protein FRC09_000701 [Ceratobasidium sp. 395]